MSYQKPVSPNIEKLFIYLRKSQWHNVSANFAGFVRKEYDTNIEKLEDNRASYRNLGLMIEYAEMGRFSEARGLIDTANREFDDMVGRIKGINSGREIETTRRQAERNGNRHTARQENDFSGQQDMYTTRGRDEVMHSQRNGMASDRHEVPPTPDRHAPPHARERHEIPPTPDRHAPPHARERHDQRMTQERHLAPPTQDQHAVPATPDRLQLQDRHVPPPTPDHHINRSKEMIHRVSTPPYYTDRPSERYNQHTENFDRMSLQSPEKPTNDHRHPQTSRFEPAVGVSTSSDQDSRQSQRRGVMNSASQMASSKALWGHDYGDKPSDKIVGSSTYRQDFPTYSVDNPERKDKERYKENFGSLADRESYRMPGEGPQRLEEVTSSGKPVNHQRHIQHTPDHDYRPSDIARKFKDIYDNEWLDAYDEICKEFGPEKTVKHLLWIVTEASLITNDIADVQIHGLERQAFDVMASPIGDDNEAWACAMDVAEHQLKDFEKSALCVMTTPGTEHRGGYIPRQLGDTVPTSRNLLHQYRKQTALLSIPYVKEECRDKISRILVDSCGFPKHYLTDTSRVTKYIYKCAELVWLMSVQEPPIILQYVNKESEGSRFNHEHYAVYTKAGNVYDFGVWPMLRLGRNGTIISKGVAQGI